jgi:hypothetical protein
MRGSDALSLETSPIKDGDELYY